jgi:RHS repeat-associated protein
LSLLTNNRDNTRTQTFTYDSLNRVITGQSTATSGDNCWGQSIPTDGTGYDRWGNLLKVNSTQCSTPGLNVGTDGLNHLSGFGYDAAGNMTNDGLYTYTYNAEGQQASTSAASQTYTYDGDGRRVKKSNGRTYWFSSVTGNLLVETDGSGTVLNQYIYFGGRRVARKDGSGDVTYYFEEPAGRTRTMTGATGVACNEADYYLFGGEQSHGNTCDQNYHFAGMYRDGETGNDYTQFRMYESNLGRWMTPDPVAGDITNPQSLNRYAYVLNNPTNFIDPLGLFCYRGAGCPDDAGTVDYLNDFDPMSALLAHAPSPGSSQGGRGRRGADGGGAGGGCEGARNAAERTVLTNMDCLDFILSTIGNAYSLYNQGQTLTSSVAAAQLAATSPTAFVNTLAGAGIVSGPYAGRGVAAYVDYPGGRTITTTPLFNGLGSAAQATVLIHDTFHLSSYGFTDEGLAKTIGWKRPGGVRDKDVPGLASAAFTEELRKHCGW